ncbi:tetratricopeptide repeat protein [Streptomyces stelliscabiei]|uniref:Tetratricopeptide (TPR) repeat protein n=1 Tax=Streptomyces stelliscabiei TaxID=146820 RepID=A0A8I0TSV6_9ACTN|nr:tetratricopeptide repeat protein [Streptomyces stelliscabiei]MBE1596648.1 tetratricopeptide (TPR) repeat protein [Streptomyces stelliscabiei]MDX2517980.1 tetratricopeptide repeat protein [Streptomyces stelliscabiei]
MEASAKRAVAIEGNNYAPVLTGDHSRVVSLPPEALRPPAQVSAPAGLDNLPVRPGLFIGRTAELDRLDGALAAPGKVVVQAVHGLGGIGKSTLANHWAATSPHGCTPRRWITADSPTAVQEGLVALAAALETSLTNALPPEALAERALQWLSTHTGWLLILDNVNDPADIAPLLARAQPQGRFLITSRLATPWHGIPTVLRLDVLDEAESLALLTSIATTTGPRDMDGAAELCAELGHLPLAIDQAAAYLAQDLLTTPRSYLDLLAQYPAVMYRDGAVTTPVERTIARIWNITLDRITALQPAAADLLRTLAWYASDEIPAALAGASVNPPARSKAIGLLTAYSMITPDPAAGTLAVHRLVQALARTSDPDDTHRTPHLVDQARTHATTHLHTALPAAWDTPDTWPTWRTLLPHIDALADHAPTDTDTDTTAEILSRAGLLLHNQGQLSRATSHLQRALADRVRVLGEDHPHTLASRNNLAYAYKSVGELGRAIELYEQTLKDRVRVLGEDHSGTLASRNNLASAYESAGDLGRAIELYEQILADRVRVLGEDHPDTLVSRNNLAGAYYTMGDLSRAIELYEQTLTDMVRVLGEDHPHTLASRNNLASAYESAGDLGRAIELYEQTLADRVRVMGEDHPHTLASRNNLAYAYQSAGGLGRAIELYEQTLTDMLRVLGEDHPDTLASRNNLAYACYTAGDLGRSIPLFEQSLADRVRVLGEDHPDTLASRNNLATAYKSVGDLGRAIELYEQTLKDRVRVVGEDHPGTLASRNNLATAYYTTGDLGCAVPLFEQTLADSLRVLGEDHPDTLASRNNLAGVYESAGDRGRAIELYVQTLADRVRVLGEDHPDTLASRNNLAYAYESAGDRGRAIELYVQTLADRVRVLGEDHPDTLVSRNNLASAIAERNGGEPEQP